MSACLASVWPSAKCAVSVTRADSVMGAEYGTPLSRARLGYRSTVRPMGKVLYDGLPTLTSENSIWMRNVLMARSCRRLLALVLHRAVDAEHLRDDRQGCPCP